MTNEDFYESLVGQSKETVLSRMDHPMTPYDSDEWIYLTGKRFLGLKERLYLFFRDNQVYDFFASSLV